MGRAISSVIAATVARYLVDEDLSPKPISLLNQLGYDVARVPVGTQDLDIIQTLGNKHGCRGVWITADRAAMTDHRQQIISSGISVALMDFHNARRDTQCFMIFSFIFRRGGLTENADVPLYLKLDVHRSRLGPDVRIRKFSL